MDCTLNISNISFIKKELAGSGLTYSHLLDDLIDHVCCDVELEMRNGLPFAKAYEVVKSKFGTEGLIRIQNETLYLIDKKYRIMKNTMKFSGLIAPILLAFGSLFRIQHWQGAGIFLVLGFFLLSFVFLPTAIYVSYQEVSNSTKKWTHIIGFLGTFFISMGFLFKVQHWPLAGSAISIGILLICLVFLPLVLRNRLTEQNDSIPKIIYVIAFAGFMLNLIGFLCKMMHWQFATGFLFSGCILLVFAAFPLYAYYAYKDHLHIESSFVFVVIVLVWFIIPITLISLNFSGNVLNNVYELNQSMENDIAFIQKSNDATIAAHRNNEKAIIINQNAGKIRDYIEDLKFNKSEIPDSVKLKQLASQITRYKETLLSFSQDEKYRSLIHRTLENPFNTNENMYHDPGFVMHNLVLLQLNVGLAEQTALRQLLHEEETALSLIQ